MSHPASAPIEEGVIEVLKNVSRRPIEPTLASDLAVVNAAQELTAARFIDALGEVQRHAMAHKLRPSESSGATLAFSSMARWNVSRHIPILPPYTSLIVSHAAPNASGHAVLGASYDHRVLSGFDAAQILRALAQPPA